MAAAAAAALMRDTAQMPMIPVLCSWCCCDGAGNGVGPGGATALAEALKVNRSITALYYDRESVVRWRPRCCAFVTESYALIGFQFKLLWVPCAVVPLIKLRFFQTTTWATPARLRLRML